MVGTPAGVPYELPGSPRGLGSLARRGLQPETDLEQVFHDHQASCVRLARSILRDEHLAQDVVQEAFLVHWRGTRYDPARLGLRQWLLMLTYRKAVDRVRQEQRGRRNAALDSGPDEALAEPGPEAAALASADAHRVRQGLLALPPVQLQVIALAHWGGYSQTEIATLTGVPLGTVKSRTQSGMVALRVILQEERFARS